VKALCRHHVNLAAQQLLQINLESPRKERGPARTDVNQKIDVTFLPASARLAEPKILTLVAPCLAAISRISSLLDFKRRSMSIDLILGFHLSPFLSLSFFYSNHLFKIFCPIPFRSVQILASSRARLLMLSPNLHRGALHLILEGSASSSVATLLRCLCPLCPLSELQIFQRIGDNNLALPSLTPSIFLSPFFSASFNHLADARRI
jgi:hypothetical protein